jgi:arylsulfatase A-like enzyme
MAQGGPAPTRPNVLLITVDTLRAAHLSSYGYAWKTSPYIDRLAQEGTRFDRAYTVIPLTGPAHLSLFTSRYPQEHGARRNGEAVSGEQTLLNLPQILRANGYRNAAFISGWPLTSRLTRMNEWFDDYDEELTRTYQLFNSGRWAEDVTPRAIEWMKKNAGKGKPVFMWVHYFDPHSPYDFRKDFADLERNGSRDATRAGDKEMQERITNYDTEIAYMDWHMGKLFAALDELKLRDSTLVVLTADHGESLGEHDYVGHGRHLFEDIIRIPLIVRFPGKVRAGSTVSAQVSLLDIAPTILDLTVHDKTARKNAPTTFVGSTLAPVLVRGERVPSRRLYYVTFPGKKGYAPKWLSWLWVNNEELPLRFGQIQGTQKVIWSPEENNHLAAYDLAHDPHEMSPRIMREGTKPYLVETVRLRTWFERTESRASEQNLSARDIQILKSLGYIQ